MDKETVEDKPFHEIVVPAIEMSRFSQRTRKYSPYFGAEIAWRDDEKKRF